MTSQMQRVADVQNNLVRDGGGVSAVAEDLRNQSNKQRVVDGRFRLDFQRALSELLVGCFS